MLLEASLSPWFVTGFIDAEATFSWSISKNIKSKLGWTLSPRFSICLSSRDASLLRSIQLYFGGIGVMKTVGNFIYYDINSASDLAVLFIHLNRFPLVSSKRYMFAIFSIIHCTYLAKEHLTPKGFMICVAYVNALNNAIKPATLLSITSRYGPLPSIALPPVQVALQFILNPEWIVGFVCGEGCFSYLTRKRVTSQGIIKIDYTLIFEVAQMPIDILLLRAILNYILFSGCRGSLFSQVNAASRIRIASLDSLQHSVLPFFTSYPLVGHKELQYSIWLEAVTLMICEPNYTDNRQLKLALILARLSKL